MNKDRRLKPAVLAIVVLLTAAAAVTSGSAAATPPGPGVAGGVVGRNPARAARPDPVAPVPGGPGFLMLNAQQLKPAFPECSWGNDNGELFNPGPRDCFYEASLTLPNNITITKMVIYFYDNSAQGDLLAAIWRFDPSTGNWVALAEVASAGAEDGYRHVADTSIVEAVVDQQRYSYIVEAGMLALGDTVRLTGVRIDYGYMNNLPLVTAGHP